MKDLYDNKYFFTECEGYNTFLSSKGLKLSKRLQKIYYHIINLKPKKVLDFGCGRGELSLNLALSKIETWGVDTSNAAIQIANSIKKYWLKSNPEIKLTFIKIQNQSLPFNNDFFDVIILSDVIEHIPAEKINFYLSEISRITRNEGYIIIHTSPNKIFSIFGLKIYWLIGLLNGILLPFKMKNILPEGLKENFHINEQTAFSLRKLLKKSGFRNIKIEFWKNPHYIYYFLKEDKYIKTINKVYSILPIKHLFFADIFVTAQKYR